MSNQSSINSRGEIPYGLPHPIHRRHPAYLISAMQHKPLYGDKPGPADGEIGPVQDSYFDNQSVGCVIWLRARARGCTLSLKNNNANEVINEPGHSAHAN